MIKAMMVFIVGSFMFLYFSHASKSGNESNQFDECVSKGDAYYRDIGSYPTLSNGRDAHSVVVEKCFQTTTAF